MNTIRLFKKLITLDEKHGLQTVWVFSNNDELYEVAYRPSWNEDPDGSNKSSSP